MNPNLVESKHILTAHINDVLTIELTKSDAKTLLDLLQTYFQKNICLGQSTWNGAVATIEDGWPKIKEQYGSYSSALYRAEKLHTKLKMPTIAYALIEAHGIAQEDIKDTDEFSIEETSNAHIDRKRRVTKLDAFFD